MFTALRLILAAALLVGLYTALTATMAAVVEKSAAVSTHGVAPPDED